MILLLDNYDSFTYNLAQYLGELGCNVEVHRNDKITVEEIARRKPERIVISPGPCTPQEAGISVELIERLAGNFPILGVCLGHQALGAAFGGKIVRAVFAIAQNEPGRHAPHAARGIGGIRITVRAIDGIAVADPAENG